MHTFSNQHLLKNDWYNKHIINWLNHTFAVAILMFRLLFASACTCIKFFLLKQKQPPPVPTPPRPQTQSPIIQTLPPAGYYTQQYMVPPNVVSMPTQQVPTSQPHNRHPKRGNYCRNVLNITFYSLDEFTCWRTLTVFS